MSGRTDEDGASFEVAGDGTGGAPGRLAAPATTSADDGAHWQPLRLATRERIATLLGDDGLLTLPTSLVEGAPIGLSLIGPRGADRSLPGSVAHIIEEHHAACG